MKRSICLAVLVAAVLGLQSEVLASGSVGPGNSNVSARGAYTTGKALVFRELACRDCPLERRELNRQRARSLKASLEAAFAEEKPGTPDDDHIKVLCTGKVQSARECAARLQYVVAYLDRRYRL